MDIKKREIRLYCNSLAVVPYFERIVLVNHHDISLRIYADGREECIVNNYVYASDTGNSGSVNASEAFEELTGCWPADWDRVYRRLWWRDFMNASSMWYGVWYGVWPVN